MKNKVHTRETVAVDIRDFEDLRYEMESLKYDNSCGDPDCCSQPSPDRLVGAVEDFLNKYATIIQHTKEN